MNAARHLLARPWLAALVCAAALLMRLLLPTGYMVAAEQGGIAVVVCPGQAPAAAMPGMAMTHGAMPGHDQPAEHGKAEAPCAFAGLSAASLGAIDPIQLALLIAFVMAVGLAGISRPLPRWSAHLRPPPTGPPARR